MDSIVDKITARLDGLPDSSLQEVLLFVEFLAWRETREINALQSVMGLLATQMRQIDEIQTDLYKGEEPAHNV